MRKNVFLIILTSILVFYVGLMIVFTFFDYQITNEVYNPKTAFGIFFEAVGPMFMPFFVIYSTVGLVMNFKIQSRLRKIFAYIGLGFFYLYATFMGAMSHLYSYAPWMFIPSIVIYIAFTVFSVYLNKQVFQKSSKLLAKHKQILLIIFVTAFASLIVVDVIKCIFGRVRYLDLTSKDQFKPWYHINDFLFNSSFPSGHTARATTTICFSLIPLYFSKEKLSYLIFGLGIVFSLSTGVSRLYEGMHYPSDVLTGFVIVFLAFFISKYYLLDKGDTIAA